MADKKSGGRFDDPFTGRFPPLTPRERAHADHARFKEVIRALGDGEVPRDIPWEDSNFQTMLLALIASQRGYKAEADKLAVIRDVFRGK